MNKKDIIKAVSTKTGFSQKDVSEVLESVLDAIVNAVKEGNDVAFSGFGKFTAYDRSARNGVNPRTGESIHIPASHIPKFKAGALFRAAVAI